MKSSIYLEPHPPPALVRILSGIVPALARGKLKVDGLRDVNTGDLLGRKSAKLNQFLFEVNIKNKVVMITGVMNPGSDVFVLDIGKPVRIYDLALKMIHLTGLGL